MKAGGGPELLDGRKIISSLVLTDSGARRVVVRTMFEPAKIHEVPAINILTCMQQFRYSDR